MCVYVCVCVCIYIKPINLFHLIHHHYTNQSNPIQPDLSYTIMAAEQQPGQTPPSPTQKAKGFFGLGKKDGSKTPTHNVAQTPLLESGNPLDKAHVPAEARNQEIVGQQGVHVEEGQSKILLALDGTEAGDKAFQYILTSKVLSNQAHIFVATVLPAQVLSGPWVAGPLSIDTKKQNELLKQLRAQALQKLQPYREQLKENGYQCTLHVLHGDARQSLIRVAQYHHVNLIVAGKRQRKGLLQSGGGATSNHLVHHSPCPVLIIK